MQKRNLILMLALLFSVVITAQEVDLTSPWSLDKCIDYAIENNITIKQQNLNVNYRENMLKRSKFDVAPSLNASMGHSLNFGKSTQADNTFINQNSQSTNGSINADVVLFNSFAKQNTIKQRNLEMQSSIEELNKIKDDISLAVTSAYLLILFNKELVLSTEEQIEVTNLQIDYNKKKVEAGRLAQGKVYETEAQLANEELVLTNYTNELNFSLLELAQLLELESADGFDIVVPEFTEGQFASSLLSYSEVYSTAVNARPEIKSKELLLESKQYETKIAEAYLYPSLSAFAGYNNFYNNKYTDLAGQKMSLSDQLDLNGQTTVGLQLSIPIFNGLSAKTNIKNSFINYENSKFELELEKNNLRKEIQQVHANAVAAMKKFYSSEKAVESTQEAFRYIEEKFSLGIVTPLEFNDAKNKLTNAQSSYIQAKYDYIFRIKILEFYIGEPLTLQN